MVAATRTGPQETLAPATAWKETGMVETKIGAWTGTGTTARTRDSVAGTDRDRDGALITAVAEGSGVSLVAGIKDALDGRCASATALSIAPYIHHLIIVVCKLASTLGVSLFYKI